MPDSLSSTADQKPSNLTKVNTYAKHVSTQSAALTEAQNKKNLNCMASEQSHRDAKASQDR